MNFIEWWADQTPFNQVGIAFVAAVTLLVLLGLCPRLKVSAVSILTHEPGASDMSGAPVCPSRV